MTSRLGDELHPRVILVEEAAVDEVALLRGVNTWLDRQDAFEQGGNAAGAHRVTHIQVELGVDVGSAQAERVQVARALEGEPHARPGHGVTAVDQVGGPQVGGTTR